VDLRRKYATTEPSPKTLSSSANLDGVTIARERFHVNLPAAVIAYFLSRHALREPPMQGRIAESSSACSGRDT
jgi:hypothetical protein